MSYKPREEVKRLLSRGISERPLLLHGTSIEAITIMLNMGFLPPCRSKDIPLVDGQLYFTPVSENLRLNGYDISLEEEQTKEEALDASKMYALLYARDHFLENQLGKLPDSFYDIPPWRKDDYFDFFIGLKMKELKAKRLSSLIVERFGVILEPNERIFNYPYYQGDDPATIRVLCPNGLPLNYLAGIKPMGEIEKRYLINFSKK